MQVIGFNFTKISAERFLNSEVTKGINTNLEFTNVEEEKLTLLKDSEAIKISFKYSINYGDKDPKKETKKNGEVIFEGNIILSATKEEAKEVMKSWKKKELPGQAKLTLFNLIIRKCSPKALDLEDQINLRLHLPLPQLMPAQKKEK